MYSKNLSDYDVSILSYLQDKKLRSLQRAPESFTRTYSSPVLIFADPDLDGLSSAAQIYRQNASLEPSVIFTRQSGIDSYLDKIEPETVYFADLFIGHRHASKMRSCPWYGNAGIYCISDKKIPQDLGPEIKIMHTPGKSTSRKTNNHYLAALCDEYAINGHPYNGAFSDGGDELDYYQLAEGLRVAEELALLGELGDGIRKPETGKSALLEKYIHLDSAIKHSYRKGDFDFLNILVRALAHDATDDPYLEDEIPGRYLAYQSEVSSACDLLKKNIIHSNPSIAIISLPPADYGDYPISVAASSLRKTYNNVVAVIGKDGRLCQMLWRGGEGTGPIIEELREKYDMRGGGHFDYEKSAGSLLVKKKHVPDVISDLRRIYIA